MATPYSSQQYRELVQQVRDCIRLHVPPGSVVLVASKGDEDFMNLVGYRAWHFPQADVGVYAGHHPANSADAIAHLKRLQVRGAQYLVFPWSARWWLDHYGALSTHLHTVHDLRISEPEVCLIFELNPAAIEEAEDADSAPAGQSDEPASVIDGPRLRLAAPARRPAARILTILARFGTERYPHALQEIDGVFARQLRAVDRTVVIVDNALPRDHMEERLDHVLIGGDNRAREFSAFDRALEFVGADIWSYDLVHFATSAFNTLYVAYLDRFEAGVLSAVTGRGVCVGHIDCYNDPVDVLTFRSQHWMRSCFLFLPPAEVKALGRLTSIVDGSRLFSGNPDEPFRDTAPVSRNYRDYVTTWLTGGDIGQGVEWHSTFRLTRETLPAFEQKAISIFNEHLLAIRLRALGCRLIDVTWLSSLLRTRSAQDIAWATGWQEQLAGRDRDSIHVGEGSRRVAVSAV